MHVTVIVKLLSHVAPTSPLDFQTRILEWVAISFSNY